LCHIIYNVPEKEVKENTLLVQQNEVKDKRKQNKTERATDFDSPISTPS
jgi:hypothetical protein